MDLSNKKVGNSSIFIIYVNGDFEKQWANAIVCLKLAVRALKKGGIFYLSEKYIILGVYG